MLVSQLLFVVFQLCATQTTEKAFSSSLEVGHAPFNWSSGISLKKAWMNRNSETSELDSQPTTSFASTSSLEDTEQLQQQQPLALQSDPLSQNLNNKEGILIPEQQKSSLKSFQCPACKKTLGNNKNFLIHWVEFHTNDSLYSCSVCGKKFGFRSRLEIHMRTHTKERPFQCSICKNNFTQPGSLKRHLRTHTGEKPFQCDICNKQFASSSQCQRHCKAFHSDLRPFVCSWCGRAFKIQWYLTRHLKRCKVGKANFLMG